MVTKEHDKKLGNLVEQKILEFFGDPDAGLGLQKSFLLKLRKSMGQKSRKLTPHADVLKKYGVR
ncbi:MAG: hypothetical protein HYY92_02545 [Parcubacteria group bacterium]|nr:hypothetical protein [Parcubacteria group bacterium]